MSGRVRPRIETLLLVSDVIRELLVDDTRSVKRSVVSSPSQPILQVQDLPSQLTSNLIVGPYN